MTNPLFPETSAPVKLYWFELSGHAHRAQLMLSLLDIPHEIIPVDLANGAHKSDDFIKLHPFGLVPVLDDNGTVIWDSNAILVYLATKYDRTRSWLPTDAVQAAHVQQWLSCAAGLLTTGPGAARLVKVFGRDSDLNQAQEIANNILNVIEKHLQRSTFLAGDVATIADISAYTYIAHAPEGGIELSSYPAIQRWLKQIEQLDRFVPMKRTEV